MPEIIDVNVETKNPDGSTDNLKDVFKYEMPVKNDLDEMVRMFGSDQVFDAAYRSIKIQAQAQGRKFMVDGVRGEELQERMSTWKPGVTFVRARVAKIQDPVKALMDDWDKLTPERRMEIMAQIQARHEATLAAASQAPIANGTSTTEVNGTGESDEPTDEEVAAAEQMLAEAEAVAELNAEQDEGDNPPSEEPAGRRGRR